MVDLNETDAQLLDRHARHSDAAAMETLVRRHVDFVYATALRQCRDPHLAGDVTQDVFLAFTAKAHRLSRDVVLVGWFHRTTCYAASNLLRRNRRRAHHERRAAMQQDEMRTTAGEADTADRLALLDGAIAKLRRVSREMILLRYFSRASMREVGSAIGVSEDAAKKRVARALDELRHQLGAPADDANAATLSLLGAAAVAPGAPDGVVSLIVQNSVAAPASAGAASSAFSGALAMTNAKPIAAAAILLLLAGGGGAVALRKAKPSPATVPASATAPAHASTLTASVGGGVTAELIAMTSHTLGEDAAAAEIWWSPSGAPLAGRPYGETSPVSLRPERWPTKPGVTRLIEFAFRLRLEDTANGPPTLRWSGATGIGLIESGMPITSPDAPGAVQDQPNDTALWYFIAFPPASSDGKRGTVRLDFATEAWTPIASATLAPGGEVTPDPTGVAVFEQLSVEKDFSEPDRWRRYRASWTKATDQEVRLIAIDGAGKERVLSPESVSAAPKNGQMDIQAFMNLKPDERMDVVSLRLEGRPYSATIEFHNIALAPGQQASPWVQSSRQRRDLGSIP